MKTIQCITLMLFIGVAFLTSCQKDEFNPISTANQQNSELKNALPITPNVILKNWEDDFSTASSLSNWYLLGVPQPSWVSSANYRFGLLNTNGQLPNGSYAVSKSRIGNGNGYVIESAVSFDITSTDGIVVSPEIAVSRKVYTPNEPFQPEAGISMKLIYIGQNVPNVPEELQNHTFIVMSMLSEDGSYETSGEYTFQAEISGTDWHKISIQVNPSGKVSFMLDDELVWSPSRKIDKKLMSNKNVMLGYLSPTNGAATYHDYLKVTYPVHYEDGVITTVTSPQE